MINRTLKANSICILHIKHWIKRVFLHWSNTRKARANLHYLSFAPSPWLLFSLVFAPYSVVSTTFNASFGYIIPLNFSSFRLIPAFLSSNQVIWTSYGFSAPRAFHNIFDFANCSFSYLLLHRDCVYYLYVYLYLYFSSYSRWFPSKYDPILPTSLCVQKPVFISNQYSARNIKRLLPNANSLRSEQTNFGYHSIDLEYRDVHHQSARHKRMPCENRNCCAFSYTITRVINCRSIQFKRPRLCVCVSRLGWIISFSLYRQYRDFLCSLFAATGLYGWMLCLSIWQFCCVSLAVEPLI